VSVVTVEVDCHDHPYHETDVEFPECGPQNLLRIAETYGMLIEHLPHHRYASWAWWYRLTGPRENIVRFLLDEYCGPDEELAAQIVDCQQVTS